MKSLVGVLLFLVVSGCLVKRSIEPGDAGSGDAGSDYATLAAAERMANVSLAELQREVVHELNELLGPMAADIAVKIERTRTLREWEVTVLAAVEAVRMGRNAETARAFAERVARIRQRAL